ncbi:L-serine ammonia-lyase, iron-sulfur-dependent, subunit alpha [bacterium]
MLGPVMRGPSSSHTAGAHGIGCVIRKLFGEKPSSVVCTFDPRGSMATTYAPLAVDRGFAAGLLDWDLTDKRFHLALDYVKKRGISIRFQIEPLVKADHPNAMQIDVKGIDGKTLSAFVKSTGGGSFLFTELDGWSVSLNGKSHVLLIEAEKQSKPQISKRIPEGIKENIVQTHPRMIFAEYQSETPFDTQLLISLEKLPGIHSVWHAPAYFNVQKGSPLFSSAKEMIALAEKKKWSLGKAVLHYEAQILSRTEDDIVNEMIRRFMIMKESVQKGLTDSGPNMMLLNPTAGKILKEEKAGNLALGGLHTRAAARAMAVMHMSNSLGVVCAAPTGGSSGVVPGVIVTLAEEKNLSEQESAMLLFSASSIGLIFAQRATFAAEVAGCQVEIGAAGAMAAAAVVEYAGGKAKQAADAAAIALQNTMGSVCDPVKGTCEIPCHTRNAVAASNAFVCADLILGGYVNPIPLDETIDASFEVGKMLPRELRCTALGGLAVTPSAVKLPSRR